MSDDDPVLVVGGGLAGVGCALKLGDEGHPVVLLDRNDYHQFQPLLYQVATAQLPAEDIARPHRGIFRDYPLVQTVTAPVAKVSLSDRSVQLEDGTVLTGSHVVLAVGAQPNFFGVPGAQEHAFPLYSVADAERLRLHVRDLVDKAAAGEGTADATLDVVVVGGGPTGVEISGALAELMEALHKHGRVPRPGRVSLVDRADTVLAAFAPKSRKYALKRLTRAGVDLRLGVGVSAVLPDRVELTDGTVLPTRTVIWGGGESAAEIAGTAGPTPGRGGRLDVQPDLRLPGFPGAYAVGDVANITAGSDPLPQLGSVAQQSGTCAAENIIREKAGQPTEPFRYKDKGIMAMIGRNAAVAEVGKRRHQVDGPVAFAAWLGVHAMLLSGAHSKTDAFLSWGWDYFDRDHAATVEASTDPSRIAWGDDQADRPHIDVGPTTTGSDA
ncbi:MAG: NAD(P)/FAD-dependent oxidoreductase [Nocardioidaceae bacterium]|nr:NAD(P)/FAD-dependent oxidoreductase [Nocardioidaceae bacterium]NUS51711.1 NAD(P)/FAD-dependent oxidoreductase [Nocardioidaceae bacterium]